MTSNQEGMARPTRPDPSAPPPPPQPPPASTSSGGPLGFLPSRSFGLKLLLVCVLALVMAIPALFVFSVVYDRSSRAERVSAEISNRYGGEQTSMGPVLVLPYTQRTYFEDQRVSEKAGQLVVYPETGSITANVETEQKKSGIHQIPIYAADLSFEARFVPSRLRDALPDDAEADWQAAKLIVSMSNSRSARQPTAISLDGAPLSVEPLKSSRTQSNTRYGNPDFTQLASALPDLENRDAEMLVTSKMTFSGARWIAFAPFARSTEINLTSDWDDPKLTGGFQHSTYDNPEDKAGFSARWTIPYEARGIPGTGNNLELSEINSPANVVRVEFVQNATPYQSVQRALKYAAMFIGFVFLAYFLFEITSARRAHPAQYVLVGLAQAVFYLLLLALAEQMGFDAAFFIASAMTVLLTSGYAMSVFKSRVYGTRAFLVLSSVYALMYMLMRMEDFALLVGAFASFAAIGLTMFMTRNIDWYGSRSEQDR